ncbi:dihydrolipoamide acetyltransferase family protein [uncultured Sphaerochaeta sp.]|uniref:dihydrolipoamide acetyltransferase family protein n=1 Tax=uncultured Sphaerochaeta sp. TaxID=886478 RepID=UPI002A0A7FD1|nr:dihydrolipoamide acetyltransferase family protein [uncultured Sphaerochaeta sp.]
MIKIIMPKMSSNMSEGIIVDVLVQSGEEVRKGDELFVIETDKTTAGIVAEDDGVAKLFDTVYPGNVFAVGDLMGFILQRNDSVPEEEILVSIKAPSQSQNEISKPPYEVPSTPSVTLTENQIDEEKPLLATPAARHVAKKNGIDLHDVKGSGPEGRIRHTDIEKILQQNHNIESPSLDVAEPATSTFGFSQRQTRTSEIVTESWRTKPHVSLFIKVDASRLMEKKTIYDTQNYWEGIGKVSLTAMLVKLTAEILNSHPRIKARPLEKGYEVREQTNIGIAVGSEKGLVVPVIADANKKSLSDINEECRLLISKSHKGTLAPNDVADGVFTISNLGMYEIESFTSIILEGQSAILSVGAIQDTVVVREKRIKICPVMTLTLNIDHRCVDGTHGAAFLSALKNKIQKM